MGLATRATAVLLVAALGVFACSDEEEAAPRKPIDPSQLPPPPPLEAGAPPQPKVNLESWPVVDPGSASPTAVTQAVATLRGLGDGLGMSDASAYGTVRFTATSQGARVGVTFAGLTFMREYTIRVHLFGDCSSGGANVGPGFNFVGSSLEQPPGAEGGMGLIAALKGEVSGNTTGQSEVPGVALRGPYSILGRAVVLHGPPSEAEPLGPPLSCGVVGLAGAQ